MERRRSRDTDMRSSGVQTVKEEERMRFSGFKAKSEDVLRGLIYVDPTWHPLDGVKHYFI